ncbi:cytochrome P450 [Amycolatopsis sp. 195334CR]|uniref:cytochrome P450 n=1 Tax=Amycolatopsis sp. 195334CR TaxID=2814588 RepID=UPI001A8CA726|nr:cytochrome P450 [Amycolatopsis sp. 195334CR]MBN6037245.1 cytochrome P450 [Amycolatopsis sp. 195334CR]
MTTSQDELPSLATEREGLLRLRPSTLLRDLQEQAPICRVRTPAGDEAWLVTRYAEVKQLLMDERIGRSHLDPGSAPKYVDNPLLDMLIIPDHEAARDAHKQTRAWLAPNFTARRVLNLKPRVEAIAASTLDSFVESGPPTDLHGGFSFPFALLVLCELIGVPLDERDRILEPLQQMGGVDDREDAEGGMGAIFAYAAELGARKRAEPGEDVISRMVQNGATDEQVGPIAANLLFAGLESVASHIDLGVALLSTNPGQLEAALANLPTAVEEVLRAAKAGGSALPRYAAEDIEIGGVTIRAGDLVLIDFTLANFDTQAFDEPSTFDVTRSPNAHLTFAHGIWHCIGAPLARVQLQVAFSALFTRLPSLRLAVPIADLQMRGGGLADGLGGLPVTW